MPDEPSTPEFATGPAGIVPVVGIELSFKVALDQQNRPIAVALREESEPTIALRRRSAS